MSQGRGASSLKRKRPGVDGKDKDLSADERMVLDVIRSKGDMGIWKGDLKKELNLANTKMVDNCIKSLLSKLKIKEVVNIKSKGKNRLMAVEFEPSTDLTGGLWYDNGNLDKDLIVSLKRLIKRNISHQKVATADGLCHVVKKSGMFSVAFSLEQIKEILDNMILEKEILKVKSNGLGEFSSFPINVDCYKVKPRQTKVGALASVPCGVCPRINQCSPDGIISPATCAYYTKWLEF